MAQRCCFKATVTTENRWFLWRTSLLHPFNLTLLQVKCLSHADAVAVANFIAKAELNLPLSEQEETLCFRCKGHHWCLWPPLLAVISQVTRIIVERTSSRTMRHVYYSFFARAHVHSCNTISRAKVNVLIAMQMTWGDIIYYFAFFLSLGARCDHTAHQ